jgi:hypothetical protein
LPALPSYVNEIISLFQLHPRHSKQAVCKIKGPPGDNIRADVIRAVTLRVVGVMSAPTRRFETPGRDLPQRTGARRVMTETIPIKKQIGLPSAWCIHATAPPALRKPRRELSAHRFKRTHFSGQEKTPRSPRDLLASSGRCDWPSGWTTTSPFVAAASQFCIANGLDTSRTQSTNVWTTGFIVRPFKVTIATGQ